MMTVHEAKVAKLVGAPEPYEHFKKVSGVPATKAAIDKLNARLAARGAPCTAACVCCADMVSAIVEGCCMSGGLLT